MPYSINEAINIFWAEHPKEASGRDPLAIQNSSVVIYANMIVGITNVTNRIRYMSFYCWLFDAISHKMQNPNDHVEQRLYLRRAELLLAYIMVKNNPEVTGISGTNYASKRLDKNIDLKEGANLKKKNEPEVYWAFGMGVFGQYYAGAVRDLDLIFHPQGEINVYAITEKGQRLAQAFATNIPAGIIDLFIRSIFAGKITEEKLIQLTPFALHSIPDKSQEQKLFREILLSEDYKSDYPTHHRSETIQLLLQLLKKNPDGVEYLTTAFLKNNYEQHAHVEILDNDTAMAWYLYEINELLHVAFEHFHAAFQYSLEKFPTDMNEVLELLQENTANVFKVEDIDPDKLTIRELSESIESERVYEYFNSMVDACWKDWGLCLNNAIKTILSVYKQCKNQKDQLFKLAKLPGNNYERPGYAIEMFVELVDSKMTLTLNEYTKKLLLQAINQHMFSSYQKSRIGQALVHNYMIEDNMAWRLRETSPGRTTPRLDNAIQYLTDTGLVNKEGKLIRITTDGLKIIEGL
jgi:hypothetical protein